MGKFHITADRSLYHSNVKVHEAFGHVVMNSGDRRLSADYAWIDQKTGDVRVRGNVSFITPRYGIQAAEMHFNLNTGTGSIFYGVVSSENYRLRGQLIRKVGEDRFLTSDGEYTTCRDCAESWKMSAKSVDLTVDGYAYLEDVYIVIKDVPTLYMPYMIVPVKTKRQTGFLFPRVGSGSRNGLSYVQPFFIAIDDHQDSTLAFGEYGKRGKRAEVQYRYKSYSGVQGFLDGFYLSDRQFDPLRDRFAVRSVNEWPFAPWFEMRWQVNDSRDRDYPTSFPEDVRGANLPAMESGISATSAHDDFFVSVEAKRYRSLINRDSVGFDKDMVQAGPSAYFGLRERPIFSFLTANFYGTFDRFYREGGSFYDANYNGIYDPYSTDRIREVQRFQMAPEIASSFRIGNLLKIQPSVQYNERLYLFNVKPTTQKVDDLHSRYVLGRVQLSTSFEKVYDTPDSDSFSSYKHQVTPIVTYSNIPWFQESNRHPFITQARLPGGAFDQFDTIPIKNRPDDLREPVGNAVSIGLISRLIRKRKIEDYDLRYPYSFVTPKKKVYSKAQNRDEELLLERARRFDEFGPVYSNYRQIWLVTVNQAFDINEAKRVSLPGEKPKAPFSPLLMRSVLSLDNFSNYVEYQYKPYGKYFSERNEYRGEHDLRVTAEWTLKSIVNPRGTLFFKRSLFSSFELVGGSNPSRKVGLGVIWSLNDYFSVGYRQDFDLINKFRISETASTTFSSPSECWQVRFNYTQRRLGGSDTSLDLAVNLMGTGYVGMGQGQGGPAMPGL